MATKDSRGVATVVYGKKVLVLHISDINENGIIVVPFEIFSTTSPGATIATFKLSLIRTELALGAGFGQSHTL